MNGDAGTESATNTTTVAASDDYKKKNEFFGSNVQVSTHPVISHKLTILRSSTTPPGTFRAVLRELTYHLGYEATSSLTTQPISITVPVPVSTTKNGGGGGGGEHIDWEGQKLVERVALIPILRSGLGMVDSMLELLPNAAVHHIGMYKVKEQNPVQYYNRLPRTCTVDIAYVLDPLIVTSSTIESVVAILKKWGVPRIHIITVLGSRSGVKQLAEAHRDICITAGSIDDTGSGSTTAATAGASTTTTATDHGMLLPGLGDSGDRLFGTVAPTDDDEESLMHPSRRRKRTLSEQLE